MNQLGEKYSEEKNLELVKAAVKGSKQALNELIGIHRPYIFNVAWKFTFDPQEAEQHSSQYRLLLSEPIRGWTTTPTE